MLREWDDLGRRARVEASGRERTRQGGTWTFVVGSSRSASEDATIRDVSIYFLSRLNGRDRATLPGE